MKGHKEQGAALFIALIILLLVSMMGVSAMKGGLFHERMAFNSQAEEMTFQAAETAIGGVIQEARKSSDLSMMGVSAMKGGLFHERMAFNSQAEEMTFQAAETAIGGVIQEARKSSALLGQLAGTSAAKTH